MLVHRIVGDCPGCGGVRKFGNVWVRPDHVRRGCLTCTYTDTVPLPPLRKKILYLDQGFLSHAFRAKIPRFVDAAERISQLSALQLLAAPFSSVHEDETNQWKGKSGKNKDDLMKFIKATSSGDEFEPAYEVEQTQISRAFQAFVSGGSPVFQLHEDDAVEEDIHAWDDYLWIDVGRYFGDVERMRTLKYQSVEALVDAFEHWRTSSETFDEQVALEIEEAARVYIDAYIAFTARIAGGDLAAVLDAPLISSVLQSLLLSLPPEKMEDRWKKVGRFLASQHFKEVPFLWLTARIYATLKEQVKNGAYTDRARAIRRLRGLYQDIKHVATYAPYCDVFFIDSAMAALVTDPRINLEGRYGVKVFTAAALDNFLTWLNELHAGMSQEHRAALTAAYP